MKRHFYYLFIMLAPIILFGCDDDDVNYEKYSQSIEIIKADKSFDQLGGTGIIEFKSDKKVTVSTNESWCQAELSGNIVNLSIPGYLGLESRYAIVTLTSEDGYSADIAITQLGYVMPLGKSFEYIVDVTESGSFKFETNYTGDIPIELESSTDWITATADENGVITVNYEASSIHREGILNVIVGPGKNKVQVIIQQIKYKYEDLLGEWTFKYNNFDKEAKTMDVIIEPGQVGSTYLVKGITVSPFNLVFTLRFDAEQINSPIYFVGNQSLGTIAQYTLHLYAWNGATGLNPSGDFRYSGLLNIEKAAFNFKSNATDYQGMGVFMKNAAGGLYISAEDLYFIDLVMERKAG